jgi:hypothetical protein
VTAERVLGDAEDLGRWDWNDRGRHLLASIEEYDAEQDCRE